MAIEAVDKNIYFLSFVRGNDTTEPSIIKENIIGDGWYIVGDYDRGGLEICALVKLIKKEKDSWGWPTDVKLFLAKNKIHLIVPAATDEKSGNKNLIFVYEYSPGSGAKRWPSFHINLEDPQIELLSTSSRTTGSGSEHTRLIIGPEDYDSNIANQFIDEKGMRGQILSYASI